MDDADRLAAARAKWTHRGSTRPPFAELPGPGQESVWDYPRPPAVVADPRRIVVGDPADPLADSVGAVRVLETASPPTVYLPPGDVRFDRLVIVPGTSSCEWKGAARYWALTSEPSTVVGWDYPEPFADFAAIAGWASFYPGRIDCRAAGEVVRPQPGGFYGGWVTDEIVGPFKGEPGTASWCQETARIDSTRRGRTRDFGSFVAEMGGCVHWSTHRLALLRRAILCSYVKRPWRVGSLRLRVGCLRAGSGRRRRRGVV